MQHRQQHLSNFVLSFCCFISFGRRAIFITWASKFSASCFNPWRDSLFSCLLRWSSYFIILFVLIHFICVRQILFFRRVYSLKAMVCSDSKASLPLYRQFTANFAYSEMCQILAHKPKRVSSKRKREYIWLRINYRVSYDELGVCEPFSLPLNQHQMVKMLKWQNNLSGIFIGNAKKILRRGR